MFRPTSVALVIFVKAVYEVKMRCRSCEKLIAEAVGEVAGVTAVKASAQKGIVEAEYAAPASAESIKKAIEAEGYSARQKA